MEQIESPPHRLAVRDDQIERIDSVTEGGIADGAHDAVHRQRRNSKRTPGACRGYYPVDRCVVVDRVDEHPKDVPLSPSTTSRSRMSLRVWNPPCLLERVRIGEPVSVDARFSWLMSRGRLVDVRLGSEVITTLSARYREFLLRRRMLRGGNPRFTAWAPSIAAPPSRIPHLFPQAARLGKASLQDHSLVKPSKRAPVLRSRTVRPGLRVMAAGQAESRSDGSLNGGRDVEGAVSFESRYGSRSPACRAHGTVPGSRRARASRTAGISAARAAAGAGARRTNVGYHVNSEHVLTSRSGLEPQWPTKNARETFKPARRRPCNDRDLPAGAPSVGNRLDAWIHAREPVLVRLIASEEPVLAHSVVEGRTDRMRQEDRPDRQICELGVTPGLVVELAAGEAKAIPRRDWPVIQLEKPKAKPAAFQCARGEFAMEFL